LLGWHPLRGGAVKRITGRALKRLLGRIHDEVALAILVGQLERVEWNCDIFFTCAKKTANTDNCSIYLAILVREKILDIADLVILGIVDALVVVVADWECSARQAGKGLLGRIGRRCGRP
jgi:hypothetical protein